jgi:hypothetical protein
MGHAPGVPDLSHLEIGVFESPLILDPVPPQTRGWGMIHNLLFYDPIDNNFGVAQKWDNGFHDIGIPGDAVGCFMAR